MFVARARTETKWYSYAFSISLAKYAYIIQKRHSRDGSQKCALVLAHIFHLNARKYGLQQHPGTKQRDCLNVIGYIIITLFIPTIERKEHAD